MNLSTSQDKKKSEELKHYVENCSQLFPEESTIRQVKHALDTYREEFLALQKNAVVPRVVRDGMPAIRGQIEGKPYGEPALEKPTVVVEAWDTDKGPPSRKRKFTPKAGVPPGAQWRVAKSLVKAINKEKLFSTEDGEPKQVDDKEDADCEMQLRHALAFDEYAIAKVLSLCEFHPQAIVAVGHIEDWKWEVTSRFLLSSELIESCWREHRKQQASQQQTKPVYGLRRFVRSGSQLGTILKHVRNIARNPTGDSYRVDDVDTLEVCADPHDAANHTLSEFYTILTVEQPFYEQPEDEELTPDTEAGMAALQLQGGTLGRTCQVVQTLLKTTLDADLSAVEAPTSSGYSKQAEQQASLSTAVMAALDYAGYLTAADCDAAAVPASVGAGNSSEGEVAPSKGILPEQPSDPEEDDMAFDLFVPCTPEVTPGAQSLDTRFSTKACVRCGVFFCERHRNAKEAPTIHNVGGALNTYLLEGASGAASIREDVKWYKKQWEVPCGKDCYRLAATSAPQPANASKAWTPEEKAKLTEWVQIMGRNPCSLADVFPGAHSCRDVHIQLAAEALPAHAVVSSDEDGDVQNVALQGSVRRKRKAKSKAVDNGRQPAAIKRNGRDESIPWSEYVPCECDPYKGCSSSCSCAKMHNFCEKHCKCGGNCKNAHQGCKCKGSCTQSNNCPCLLQQRECDPARCVGCCPTAHGTVAPGSVVCQNMNLLLGVTRKVAVGLSDVAGWGCFVMEDIKEGEYIGEYTGELLTNEECERRGAVYDRRDTSYLFSLNDAWVIDAQKVGNKLRFANHKKNSNAVARVMMLGGDHHVGIYAKTNLPAGTEIFYDYGYGSGRGEQWCPDWAEQKG